MGYDTQFEGHVEVSPPLNEHEVEYLNRFASTRRMEHKQGPYAAVRGSDGLYRDDPDVINYNSPPAGQPGLWCQWVVTDDGKFIEWDEGEKFYNAEEWMVYIIGHFLMPGGLASKSGDPQFEHFTFDHTVNGEIGARGDDFDDIWTLVVTDNVVSTVAGLR